jgi:hypothetical protein
VLLKVESGMGLKISFEHDEGIYMSMMSAYIC